MGVSRVSVARWETNQHGIRESAARFLLVLVKHEEKVMAFKRTHNGNCWGGDCKCLWLLDYRPLGVKGPRRIIQFATKKAAEVHRASTQVKVRHGEYVDPAKTPTFKAAAEFWYASETDRCVSHASRSAIALGQAPVPAARRPAAQPHNRRDGRVASQTICARRSMRREPSTQS